MKTDVDKCNKTYKGENYKFKLGDGECNTEECDWDHGDCLSSNDLFDQGQGLELPSSVDPCLFT